MTRNRSQQVGAIRRRSLLGGGLALAGSASVPSLRVFASERAAQTIRVSFVRAAVCAPALVLQRFLPDGWKAELTAFSSPTDQTNALLTDSMDVAYTGLTVGIVARSRDQPISIVANGAGKGTGIVAASKSDIRTIAELKGKRVGNLPLSIHEVLLREELRKVGLQISDLMTIRLASADMAGALQRGDIDAFSGSEPNVTTTVLGGYGRVISYPYENPVGDINVGVLSSDMAVKTKAEMMSVWGVAHAKATEFLAGDPDVWADLVAREWGYNRTATRASMKNIRLAWTIDEKFMSELVAFAGRLKELGLISRLPDERKLIARQFVEGVKL